MSEQDAVDRSSDPITVDRLVSDLHELGVEPGDTIIVHSSLSALGWVCGGPPAVVDALCAAVTDAGTVVCPTHSGGYSDPDYWENPPVPDDWKERIRETMPAYRPAVTPTRGMGVIPETFRTYPGVIRSRHPTVSFAAWGADAESVTADHSYDEPLGEESPLARVYDLGGKVLLLGVGYDRNTSLHLAEYRDEHPPQLKANGAPILEDGERTWLRYADLEVFSDDFPDAGRAFEAENPDVVSIGPVGAATARLCDQPKLVDFAAEWFSEHRPDSLPNVNDVY
ncbi:aminoglycoside N(3)-acetyltransferase [Haloarchaeobius sp. DFWS5]|uniref:aminoglycoside N(3)-acetyltransferase n=1 Tax=Haloarchaeobius sp. DFWS5 TaxID=3446114 RepID=UPI003EB8791A